MASLPNASTSSPSALLLNAGTAQLSARDLRELRVRQQLLVASSCGIGSLAAAHRLEMPDEEGEVETAENDEHDAAAAAAEEAAQPSAMSFRDHLYALSAASPNPLPPVLRHHRSSANTHATAAAATSSVDIDTTGVESFLPVDGAAEHDDHVTDTDSSAPATTLRHMPSDALQASGAGTDELSSGSNVNNTDDIGDAISTEGHTPEEEQEDADGRPRALVFAGLQELADVTRLEESPRHTEALAAVAASPHFVRHIATSPPQHSPARPLGTAAAASTGQTAASFAPQRRCNRILMMCTALGQKDTPQWPRWKLEHLAATRGVEDLAMLAVTRNESFIATIRNGRVTTRDLGHGRQTLTPTLLREFLDEFYEEGRSYFVYGGHGNSDVLGFNQNHRMQVHELGACMGHRYFLGILLDACLLASLDTAYYLRNNAPYIGASEGYMWEEDTWAENHMFNAYTAQLMSRDRDGYRVLRLVGEEYTTRSRMADFSVIDTKFAAALWERVHLEHLAEMHSAVRLKREVREGHQPVGMDTKLDFDPKMLPHGGNSAPPVMGTSLAGPDGLPSGFVLRQPAGAAATTAVPAGLPPAPGQQPHHHPSNHHVAQRHPPQTTPPLAGRHLPMRFGGSPLQRAAKPVGPGGFGPSSLMPPLGNHTQPAQHGGGAAAGSQPAPSGAHQQQPPQPPHAHHPRPQQVLQGAGLPRTAQNAFVLLHLGLPGVALPVPLVPGGTHDASSAMQMLEVPPPDFPPDVTDEGFPVPRSWAFRKNFDIPNALYTEEEGDEHIVDLRACIEHDEVTLQLLNAVVAWHRGPANCNVYDQPHLGGLNASLSQYSAHSLRKPVPAPQALQLARSFAEAALETSPQLPSVALPALAASLGASPPLAPTLILQTPPLQGDRDVSHITAIEV